MNPYLLNTLEFTPLILERLLDAIPQNRWDERTDPERFSFREAMAHLADWEPIMLQRIKAGVDSPGAEVKGIDEGVRAVEQGYASWDPRESVRKFKEARHETATYLRGLGADAWQGFINHNEKGRMSTYDHANMLLGHDLYHLEHATQFLQAKVAATW